MSQWRSIVSRYSLTSWNLNHVRPHQWKSTSAFPVRARSRKFELQVKELGLVNVPSHRGNFHGKFHLRRWNISRPKSVSVRTQRPLRILIVLQSALPVSVRTVHVSRLLCNGAQCATYLSMSPAGDTDITKITKTYYIYLWAKMV
jgi:hypothetical protein